MKKLKVFLSIFLVLFLFACNSSANQQSGDSDNSSNQETHVLKVSHAYSTSSFMHTFMEWFNEEIKKRSDGRLSLDIYPNAQLMPPDQEMPAVLQGQIDMSHSLSPVLAGFDPVWNLYELPFVFDYDPNDTSVFIENRAKFNDSENGGKKIEKMMEEKGVKVLSLGFVDMFGSIFTTDESNKINVPDKAEGLKIRTAGGTIGAATASAIGANSMTVSANELITALQQKVIDSLLTTPIYANDSKLPVKSLTVVPLFNTVTPLVISLEKFESLPEDLQQILVQTGQDLEEYGKAEVIKKAETAYATLEEQGVNIYYPTKEEIGIWGKATESVREIYIKEVEVGKELLEEVSNLSE